MGEPSQTILGRKHGRHSHHRQPHDGRAPAEAGQPDIELVQMLAIVRIQIGSFIKSQKRQGPFIAFRFSVGTNSPGAR